MPGAGADPGDYSDSYAVDGNFHYQDHVRALCSVGEPSAKYFDSTHIFQLRKAQDAHFQAAFGGDQSHNLHLINNSNLILKHGTGRQKEQNIVWTKMPDMKMAEFMTNHQIG